MQMMFFAAWLVGSICDVKINKLFPVMKQQLRLIDLP